jgi:hypothetical protein
MNFPLILKSLIGCLRTLRLQHKDLKISEKILKVYPKKEVICGLIDDTTPKEAGTAHACKLREAEWVFQ